MNRWSADTMGTLSSHTPNVVRGAAAGTVVTARFDVPLGERLQLPTGVGERLRAEAQAAGFAAGWAEGRRKAEDEARVARATFAAQAQAALAAREVDTARLLGAVAAAVERFEWRAVPAVAGIEDDLVAAAFALAESIIGRDLATAAEPGRDALARALALAPPSKAAVVRMNPADAAGLRELTTIDGRDILVVADSSLASGDAVVDCDSTSIDARISTGLERARAALAGATR